MNGLTMLPSPAAERERFVRELRRNWCWHRYMASEHEFVAFMVQNGMPDSEARRWLAEAAGTAEGAADE